MTRPLALALAVALAASTAAAVAAAPVAHAARTIDLRHARSVQIIGARPGDHASGVGAAGDVNGDGLADVLVVAPGADPAGRKDAGAVYVVFGRRIRQSRTRVAVPEPAQGFRILGPQPGDQLTRAVAAGDVNGDGLADVLVAAIYADHEEGAAYIVFGKRDSTPVDLAHLGAGGIRIASTQPSFALGFGVAGGRDVNGDGRADVVVTDAPARHDAYVIFGGGSAGAIDVADLGAGGYALRNASGNVSLAADMNGDGRAEVVAATTATPKQPALAHVAFGKATTDPVDLSALGAAGFSIVGPATRGAGPVAVAGGGDVDGDGRGDVVVGATPRLSRRGKVIRMLPSRAFVVYGAPSADPVSIAEPSPRVLTIQAPPLADPILRVNHGAVVNGFDQSGFVVALVGDLDGDGLTDIALNGIDTPRGREDAGSAWVVHGRRGAATVNLAAQGSGAVRIDGAYAGDGLRDVAPAGGDFDGDGRPDLILGGGGATRNSRRAAGIAWIVSGVRP